MTEWIHHCLEYWGAGGMLLIPLAVVSIGIWACFSRSRTAIIIRIRQADMLWDDLECHHHKPHTIEQAKQRLSKHPSAIAHPFLQALDAITRGEEPRAAFIVQEEQCLESLKKDFIWIAALTAAAPLLGLLGTVMGMIETFQAVSAVSGDTGMRVASGISKALLTTQFGLIIALPGVFGASRLSRLIQHAGTRLTQCRSSLLELTGECPTSYPTLNQQGVQP